MELLKEKKLLERNIEMFKIFKGYIKWKLISMIKDRLIHYTSQEYYSSQRHTEWVLKEYTDMRLTKQQFERERQEQISWASAQWVMNRYKSETIKEILKIIESM
jgi:molybdenum cofactor biosynthesis enzyme MoaA